MLNNYGYKITKYTCFSCQALTTQFIFEIFENTLVYLTYRENWFNSMLRGEAL